MGLDLNSGVGLLKLGTVIIGLVCFVASFIGYFNNSMYAYPQYNSHVTPEEVCKHPPANYVPPGHYYPPGSHYMGYSKCPQTGLATVSIIIICIAFWLSFIMLIVLLFIDIGGPFKMIDFIGHIVAGVFMIITAILLWVYASEHYDYRDWNCSRPLVKVPCNKKSNEQSEFPTGFVITGVFCLIDGIIYIVAGVFIFMS